jgi:hypothetical protein
MHLGSRFSYNIGSWNAYQLPRDFCLHCGQVIVLLSLIVYCNLGDTVASQVNRMWETFTPDDPSFAKGDRIMLVSVFKWFKVGF